MPTWSIAVNMCGTRSEEHTSELQSHSDLHSFPTRRSSDLVHHLHAEGLPVELDRLVEIRHGDADVVDRGEHVRHATRPREWRMGFQRHSPLTRRASATYQTNVWA